MGYGDKIHSILISRLKLGNGFLYQLNAKGSTPSEVLGSEYKTVLKPALASFAEDIKRSSMGKFEELISLRQKSGENAAKLEEKQNRISALQSHIDKVSKEELILNTSNVHVTPRMAFFTCIYTDQFPLIHQVSLFIRSPICD